jgi:hypothetical protein
MGFVKSSNHPQFEVFTQRNAGETVYALQGMKDSPGDISAGDIIVQTKAGRRSALEAYRQAKAKDRANVEVKAEGDCLSKGNDEDFVEFGFATSRALRLRENIFSIIFFKLGPFSLIGCFSRASLGLGG